MKQIALYLLLASAAWGQTYVTINGPLASGDGLGWSGVVVVSHPAWTCGSTSVGPERFAVKVTGGVFSKAFLADCPAPYTVDYTGSSTGRAYWTIPSTLGLSATIRDVQGDFRPTPYFQLSHAMIAVPPGGGTGKCWGSNSDGTAWQWNTCSTGGGGGGTWGSITGTLTTQLDLKTALDGKAGLSHGHTLDQVVGAQAAINAKEDAITAGSSGWWRYDKTWTSPAKGDVGLGNVDNTADTAKPISTATQTALDLKSPILSAGTCLSMVSTTVGIDTSCLPIYERLAGVPSYSAPAGSILRWDTNTNFLYIANGTTAWDVVFKQGTVIPNASVPAATPSAFGGSKDYTCTTGQHAQSMSGGITTCAADTGTTGGSTTGLYTGTLDFGAIPDGACAGLTFTATGIVANKTLALSVPAAWDTGLTAIAFVSAADTVKVRACNFSGAAVDPASGTFKVRDMDSLGYLTASATIDFGAIPDGACLASTITLTGAATGDNVAASWPAAFETGLTGHMFVSAANTIAVRACNWSGASLNPASGTFKAAITR